MRKFFTPTTPPNPYWRHFERRKLALEYCAVAWPYQERPATARVRALTRHWTIPVLIPQDNPKAELGYWSAYSSVANFQDPLSPDAEAAAHDLAFAAMRLFLATQSGILYDERAAAWEPFHLGYGCLGYYNSQAITYDPPHTLNWAKFPLQK